VQAVVKVDPANTGCPTSGANPKGCVMRYQASGPNAGYFVTDGSNGYPIIAADGVAHRITLNWATGSGRTSASGSFTNVQRSYSAGAASDPVDYINISELGPQANSLTIGSHNLSVTVGIVGSLQANSSDPAAPAVALKVGGSRTQAIDCEPGKNLRDELATGCSPTFAINHGTACQAYTYYQSLPQTAPWDCTITQTGGAVGQEYQGMLDRTQGGSTSCVNPINWRDADGDGKVNGDDFKLLYTNFGKYGTLAQGDFTGDERVDFKDFQILEQAYLSASAYPYNPFGATGAVLSEFAEAAALDSLFASLAPEPGVGLMAVGVLWGVMGRRRK